MPVEQRNHTHTPAWGCPSPLPQNAFTELFRGYVFSLLSNFRADYKPRELCWIPLILCPVVTSTTHPLSQKSVCTVCGVCENGPNAVCGCRNLYWLEIALNSSLKLFGKQFPLAPFSCGKGRVIYWPELVWGSCCTSAACAVLCHPWLSSFLSGPLIRVTALSVAEVAGLCAILCVQTYFQVWFWESCICIA